MKNKILIALASLALIQQAASAQENPNAVTEKDVHLSAVLRVVLQNNPTLKAARAQWQSVRERVPQAAAWEDPKIDFAQKVARFPSVPSESFTDTSVALEQSIPVSGRNRSLQRGAQAQALSTYEASRRAELDTILRTKKAFYRFETAYAELDLNRQSGDLLRQFSEISRAKYETGSHSQADVLMAETELAKNSETAVEIERELSDAQSELNLLMNRAPGNFIGPPHVEPHEGKQHSLQAAYAIALQHRPELQMARANVDAEKARVQFAKRAWIPDPALRVIVSRYNDASNAVSEIGAGVTFNVPWVNPGKYSAQIREAQAALESAQNLLEAQGTQTLALVRDQIRKIETYHHHAMLYRDSILPLGEQTVKAAQSGYESDKSSFLELIASQNSLTNLKREELAHIRDEKISTAELEALIGSDGTTFSTKQNKQP